MRCVWFSVKTLDINLLLLHLTECGKPGSISVFFAAKSQQADVKSNYGDSEKSKFDENLRDPDDILDSSSLCQKEVLIGGDTEDNRFYLILLNCVKCKNS